MTDVQLTELEADGEEEDGDGTIQTSAAITRWMQNQWYSPPESVLVNKTTSVSNDSH